MRDVVFFDYWTAGIRHFAPIANHLKEYGIECMLLHVGSWRDPNVPREEVIEELLCRDIRFYDGSLQRAINLESPRIVLTLNAQTEDRILNRICRTQGIKSVFLMHGILAAAEDFKADNRMVDNAFGLRERVQRIPKYARLFGQYLKAMRRESFNELITPSNYAYFMRVMLCPRATFNIAWSHKDAYADKALVYAEAYRRLFVQRMKYPAERVVVVGNYNLDPLFELLKRPDAQNVARAYIEQIGVPSGKPAVAYMEGGYLAVGGGPAGWSLQTVIDEIRLVADAVKNAGMHLLIKLHPVTDPEPFLQAFISDDEVHVLAQADLPKLILGCIATLGHTSSTLMLPIVCNRPLLIVTFSPDIEKVGSYLRQRVGERVASPQEITETLLRILKHGHKPSLERGKFITDFITHSDGRSRERIVSEILKLLDGSRGGH